MKYPRALIFLAITLLVMIAGFYLTMASSPLQLPPAIQLNAEGQPTVGNADALVHLIIFEEPKCPDCKYFTNHIFPKIKKNFIDTNKVLYTIIPVSFLPDSMLAAMAWLCVFNQEVESSHRDLFLSYVNYMYAHQPPVDANWATIANLEKLAREANPAIHLGVLKDCMTRESYRRQIEKNTDYGMEIMGGELGTPTLYVNGIRVEEMSYGSISQLIHAELFQTQGKVRGEDGYRH